MGDFNATAVAIVRPYVRNVRATDVQSNGTGASRRKLHVSTRRAVPRKRCMRCLRHSVRPRRHAEVEPLTSRRHVVLVYSSQRYLYNCCLQSFISKFQFRTGFTLVTGQEGSTPGNSSWLAAACTQNPTTDHTVQMAKVAMYCLAVLVLLAVQVVGQEASRCHAGVQPVCSDGKTYSNACAAQKAGARAWIEEACGAGWKCGCPRNIDYVCAKGKTSSNPCTAKCEGYLIYSKGQCPAKPPAVCTKCPQTVAPVCFERKTYRNACLAKCMGVKAWNSGICGTSICLAVVDPVCANGIFTFSNDCEAKSHGYLTYTKGDCKV